MVTCREASKQLGNGAVEDARNLRKGRRSVLPTFSGSPLHALVSTVRYDCPGARRQFDNSGSDLLCKRRPAFSPDPELFLFAGDKTASSAQFAGLATTVLTMRGKKPEQVASARGFCLDANGGSLAGSLVKDMKTPVREGPRRGVP